MSSHTDPNQLPVYDITQHNILYTDTFKEWADKCNAVIDVLDRTDFLVAEELSDVVFKSGDFINGSLVSGALQTISAPKTFEAITLFKDDVTFDNLADVIFKDSVTFEDDNLIKDTGSLTVEGPSIFWNEIAIKQDTEHGISEQTIGYRANDEKYTRLISSAPFEVPKLIVTGNFIELNSIHYELPDDSYGNDNETKHGNDETDGRVYYLKNIGTKLAGDIAEQDGEINGGPTTSNNLIWQKDLSSMSFSPEHNIEYHGPDGELKDSFYIPDRNATTLDCTNINNHAPVITGNLQPENAPEIPKDGHIHVEIWKAPLPTGKCTTINSCYDDVNG